VEHFIPYRINGHLGSGQFASVERGLWKDGARNIPVAVKLLKEGATKMDKVKFLQEAAIMAQFRHPNVVSLYGVVSKTEPVCYKLKHPLLI
jgi:serine/threonine protein kinase